MSTEQDLNTQIAQRLFGWTFHPDLALWQDQWQNWRHPWGVPAYTTDPAATALVWQWLETHASHWIVSYARRRGNLPHSHRVEVWEEHRPWPAHCAQGDVSGETLPETLCRAALALAEALEQGEVLR